MKAGHSTDEAGSERRRTRRRRQLEDHHIQHARVRPGSDAALIDVSAGGALIETAHRLLPGTAIELHLTSDAGRVAVRGRVMRCTVVQVRPAGIWYRGAIAFDRSLPWFLDRDDAGYSVPGAESRPGRHRREETTPYVL